MIKHFSSLYVGHIELDNIGADGTAPEDRRYPNERLTECFGMAESIAKQMDSQGYYALWMAEHHFQREGYECIPNLLMLSTYLSTQTKRLKFGCAFNIVPMWHPLRLAEDFAMADILSGGRVIFGVGRGYHTREVETFGSPMLDNDANKELFMEQMEIIFKAFNEESFTHKGKHYTLPAEVPYRGYDLKDITLVPRPLHRPVDVWQPIASRRTLRYIAQIGIKGVVHGTGEKLADEVIHEYQDAAAEVGRELVLGENLALGLFFYIDGSQEKEGREKRTKHQRGTVPAHHRSYARRPVRRTDEYADDAGSKARGDDSRGQGLYKLQDDQHDHGCQASLEDKRPRVFDESRVSPDPLLSGFRIQPGEQPKEDQIVVKLPVPPSQQHPGQQNRSHPAASGPASPTTPEDHNLKGPHPVQPDSGAGGWQDVLHEAGDARKHNPSPIWEKFGSPTEVTEHLLPKVGRRQHQHWGLDIFQERSQVAARVGLEALYHVRGSCLHLVGVPADVFGWNQVRVQAPAYRVFNPTFDTLPVNELRAFLVMGVEARRRGADGEGAQPLLMSS